MPRDPIWRFPSRNGGIDFIQDPSSAHFSDDPVPKMVRELIQNSLDARQPGRDAHPIEVTFTDTKVPRELIGANDLAEHVAACSDRACKQGHRKVAKMYESALRTLKSEQIRCLRVTDSTTTGLVGNSWDALVIQEGAVKKSSQGAPGGSYGIGKNAVFNVSDLRTVFYSTRYVDEMKEGLVEKLQGKATLMSHPNPRNEHEYLQHIGFCNISENSAADIAPFFRLKENGTGVFIMGFNPRSEDWIRDVQRAVIENFFHAIHHKRLRVHISSPTISKAIEITFETIDHLFDVSPGSGTSDSYHYYRAIRDEPRESTPEIGDIGTLNVHILTATGPRRTAYVNRNGMLITASREQKVNPIAPRGKSLWPDYAAVVIPAGDKGDRWIRDMEPPSHDSISTGQLDDPDDRRIADRIFERARRAIRELIDRKAEIEKFGDTSNLNELADVFPDEFDPDIKGNRVLPVRQIEHRIRERPQDGGYSVGIGSSDDSRGGGIVTPPSGQGGTDDSEAKDSEDSEGDDDLSSKLRDRGPSAVRSPQITRPRIIHTGDREAVVAFTSQRDEPTRVRLALMPAGEHSETENPIYVEHVAAIGDQDADIEIDDGLITLSLHANQRVVLRVTTRDPIANLAMKLR